MRIGVMLRAFNQHPSGVRIYTHALLRSLLGLQTEHQFVLLYNRPGLVGTFSGAANVEEISIGPARPAWAWDQFSVDRIARKAHVDVLFNPKYSLPLGATCRTAFVCHGLDWYVMPWGSEWIDRLSHRYLIPRYARKADSIIAVSDTTRQHMIEFLHIQPERVHTVLSGVDEAFRESLPAETLVQIRTRLGLPEKFLLYCGQIYPPKNFSRLLQAYARVGPSLGLPLVVAGQPGWLFKEDLRWIERLGISPWVIRTGWLDQASLRAVYQSAEALLSPSLYESFGLPLVEAMASGTPVLTSDRYGSREIAADAALLVQPEDVDSIADGIRQIVCDTMLRSRLIEAGRRRASAFSWTRCAQETLSVLEQTMLV